jgi:hypothetical protein
LSTAFGIGKVTPLGFDHRELLSTVYQHIVSNILFRAFTGTLQSAQSDDLTVHTATIDNTPSCIL